MIVISINLLPTFTVAYVKAQLLILYLRVKKFKHGLNFFFPERGKCGALLFNLKHDVISVLAISC